MYKVIKTILDSFFAFIVTPRRLQVNRSKEKPAAAFAKKIIGPTEKSTVQKKNLPQRSQKKIIGQTERMNNFARVRPVRWLVLQLRWLVSQH